MNLNKSSIVFATSEGETHTVLPSFSQPCLFIFEVFFSAEKPFISWDQCFLEQQRFLPKRRVYNWRPFSLCVKKFETKKNRRNIICLTLSQDKPFAFIERHRQDVFYISQFSVCVLNLQFTWWRHKKGGGDKRWPQTQEMLYTWCYTISWIFMRNNKFFMFTQPLTMSYSLFTTKAEKVVLENENHFLKKIVAQVSIKLRWTNNPILGEYQTTGFPIKLLNWFRDWSEKWDWVF